MLQTTSFQEVVQEAIARPFQDLAEFSIALSVLKEEAIFSLDFIWVFVQNLYNRIIDSPSNETRRACLGAWIRLLELISKYPECHSSLVPFCIGLNMKTLWRKPEELRQDSDVFMQTINQNESRFYALVIDLLVMHNIDSITQKQGKQWLRARLKQKSIWVRLAYSWKIQNLFALDFDWCKNMLDSIFMQTPSLTPACMMVACTGTDLVIPCMTEIFCRHEALPKIFTLASKYKNQREGLDRIFDYCCAAYSFSQLDQASFYAWIDVLEPVYFSTLFRSLAANKNGELRAPLSATYADVWKYILNSKVSTPADEIALANAFFENIRLLREANSGVWEGVYWAASRTTLGYGAYDFAELMIRLQDRYCEEMGISAIQIIKHLDVRDLNILKKMLSVVVRYDEDRFHEMCNAAIEKGYFTSQLIEYQADPSKLFA